MMILRVATLCFGSQEQERGVLPRKTLPKADLKALGELIKRKREARLWTQEDLASKIGVAPNTVTRWEGGISLSNVLCPTEVDQVAPDQQGRFFSLRIGRAFRDPGNHSTTSASQADL
jgi:DNA-binding XRE family transcriptional regulator